MSLSLINKSSLSGSSPIFLNNKAVVAYYGPIRQELKKIPELLDFLAEPVVKRDEDTIEWYSSLDGTFLRVHDLPPEEQALAFQKINEKSTLFWEHAERLKESRDIKTKQLGLFMQEAISHLDVCDFFIANGTPTASLWGHTQAESFFYPHGPIAAQVPVVEEPPPPPPPPPPKPKLNISFKKLFLLMATGFICGLAMLLVLSFIFYPEPLFSLNYALGVPGPKSAEIQNYNREMALAKTRIYEEKIKYLDAHKSCLIIPKNDTDNFAYLEGCFRLPEAQFLNSETGGEAKLSFCTESGKAKIQIEENSGAKCQSDAKLSHSNNDLVLESQNEIECGGGKSYPKLSILCQPGVPAGVAAKCNLVEKNWEGKDYQPIPIVPKR